MKRLLLFACVCAAGAFGPIPVSRSCAGGSPYEHGRFRGRIAWSGDGNHNDPDDWAASPVALAIFAACGARDRLVHFDYNCILPQTDPEWEKTHAESVLGAAGRHGYARSVFHDCRKDLEGALASIAGAINDSSPENPLYFIIAGPMEVPFLGIQKADPDKRKYVYCISHSRWNDGYAATYKFSHTKRSVIASDVHWVQIRDQNRLLSTSPYGREAKPEQWRPYHWMRDSIDPAIHFLWERMQVSRRPDPSDAGMAYFLMTGDEQADPVKLEALLARHVVPPPVEVRDRVRLEAENFRDLDAYEVEDRNDKTASHALAVKRAAGAGGRIATPFDEPYTATRGRYDVEVRYGDELEHPSRFTLLINGVAAGPSWGSPGASRGWATRTLHDLEIRTGDAIAVVTQGAPGRLDYVQLDRHGPGPAPAPSP
jgi:hypothetical protein